MLRNKWLWTAALALPIAVAGVVFAASQASSYICPLTGDELRCEKCCPINQDG